MLPKRAVKGTDGVDDYNLKKSMAFKRLPMVRPPIGDLNYPAILRYRSKAVDRRHEHSVDRYDRLEY